jgi:hypothetical protein
MEKRTILSMIFWNITLLQKSKTTQQPQNE